MRINEDLELPRHAAQRKVYGTLALLLHVSEWHDFYYSSSCKLNNFSHLFALLPLSTGICSL